VSGANGAGEFPCRGIDKGRGVPYELFIFGAVFNFFAFIFRRADIFCVSPKAERAQRFLYTRKPSRISKVRFV